MPFNVAVVGAAGGIGQPLSLLMKNNLMVKDLTLYDVVNTPGVAADLSHICTPSKVQGFLGDDIGSALKGRDIVIIPAGVPRKPGMTRDDLFNTNAGIVAKLAQACAEHCPDACFLIISNPVNSTVPIFAEVLKKAGVYNPKKLFGVTTLDIVRAKTFIAEMKGVEVGEVDVPVVGGHSGATIVPLLSQSGHTFTPEEVKTLTHRIQFGGDEVVQAKAGLGSATLSMAFAGAEFATAVMKGLAGEAGVKACTYIENSNITDAIPTSFFSSVVTLGREGVAEVHPMPTGINAFETDLLKTGIEQLTTNIQKAHEFVEKM
eukprot:TRINITY_DN282_c1_g2_i1.p1 TRINITY_DN282_c1_g2~~TRINITY_DN282_c1_g2_i1.p1  ORF type:complete len:318 (+),score=110.63 TRINITY_DN282_c1_g2_i1:77-1030(+)